MNKKVLIIGPDFYGYNKSISNAFLRLGYEVKTVNFSETYPNNLKNKFRCSLLSKFGINHFIQEYNKNLNDEILKIYKKFNPEIVIIIKGHKISKETLIKMDNSIKILWMMDSIFNVNHTYKLLNFYDHLFMFEYTDVINLEKNKIKSYFLPLAVDKNVYYPLNSDEENIDILFVGALYKNRIKVLEEVINCFSDLNIKIYGQFLNWKYPDRYIKYFFKEYKNYFLNKNISPQKLNSLYSKSKISLNIHHKQTKYGCNQRFFEILGSRGFQIVDYNKYLSDFFVPGKHFVTYKNINSLLYSIDKYLDMPNKRKKISNNGYNIAINNHTFLDRAKKIIEVIKE